jgi:3-phenylpropionate/trans-cinnamate dioxygenase ferredoxin component
VTAGTRACAASELTVGAAKKVVIDGIPIAVVIDSAGTVHAIGDTCTHGDISLSEGFVEDDTLECWAHGSKFSLATGVPLTLPAYEPVPVYRVTVEGDDVLIDPTPIDPSDLVAH